MRGRENYMNVKVAKFGGSSLADATQFKKVKAIIEADSERLYVVPSAPGKRTYKDKKVTDMLYYCQSLSAEGRAFDEVFDEIAQRYIDIEQALSLRTDIRGHLHKIYSDIKNGASADYAASRGEYLNGILLADFLGFRFMDAAELILFDATGRFDSEGTQKHLTECLATERNIVVPGFYGSIAGSSGKQIKVFPRGGSDISGAIVARGVNADIYENWTDVSGFMMADPRVVKDPLTIHTITYSELRELAYMGATVLHEDSIFPVRQACIPIHVCNTNAPEAEGTFIIPDSDAKPADGKMTGIAGRRGFTVITIQKDNMHNEVGFGFRVLSVLNKLGISFEHIPTGIDTMCVVIADAEIEGKRKTVIDDILANCNADSVEIYDGLALLATVGRGMVNAIGTSARLFGALAKAGVNVRMIDQGSSEMNIIVGVESSEFETAMRAIYEAFKADAC